MEAPASPAPVSAPSTRPGRLSWLTGNLWFRFLVRRLVSLIVVLVFLVVGVFFMVHLVPGDPVIAAVGFDSPPARIQQIRHENGFDQPLLTQLWRYVENLVQGDMGKEFVSDQAVSDTIKERLPSSLILAGVSLAVVTLVSIPLGLLAAALTRDGRHRKLELGFVTTTSVLGSIPELLSLTFLIFVFALKLEWLPVAGFGSAEQLILPVAGLVLPATMVLARIVRVETLNVLAQDYMRTAISKGLPFRLVFFKHVLPNVLTATLTVLGLVFAGLVGGAVIVETLFNRPGLGSTLVRGVISKEYSLVQGVVLVLGIVVVLVNALIDVLIAILDPRSLTRHA
jgi:peptide/nickel transport system permease protein